MVLHGVPPHRVASLKVRKGAFDALKEGCGAAENSAMAGKTRDRQTSSIKRKEKVNEARKKKDARKWICTQSGWVGGGGFFVWVGREGGWWGRWRRGGQWFRIFDVHPFPGVAEEHY